MTQYVRVREKANPSRQRVFTVAMAHALRDKYEVIADGSESLQEVQQELPNGATAEVKAADVGEEGVELANARKEYEEVFGEKPHGRLQLKSILKLIEQKKGENQNA